MTTLMCVFFASCIYYAEGLDYSMDHFQDEYPDGAYIRPTTDGYGIEVTPFRSILYAFWWFFTTATTVGYGDDYPTTTVGRLVGIITFYTGIVLVALPITIVGGSFTKFYPLWVEEWLTPAQEQRDEEAAERASKCSSDGQASPPNIRLSSQTAQHPVDSHVAVNAYPPSVALPGEMTTSKLSSDGLSSGARLALQVSQDEERHCEMSASSAQVYKHDAKKPGAPRPPDNFTAPKPPVIAPTMISGIDD